MLLTSSMSDSPLGKQLFQLLDFSYISLSLSSVAIASIVNIYVALFKPVFF